MAKQHLVVRSRGSLTTYYNAKAGLRRILNKAFAFLQYYAELIAI